MLSDISAAIAPKHASAIVCNNTSASEWPINPFSCGIVIPPIINGRPSANSCTSKPCPPETSLLPP